MVSKVKALWEKIEIIGLTETAKKQFEAEYIRSTNRISIINFALTFQAAIWVYFVLPNHHLSAIVAILAFCNLIALPLDYFGFYRLEKVSPWVISTFGVFICSLGLYIVKEIVKKLKGEITVQSTVNKGTTFVVYLPNHHQS